MAILLAALLATAAEAATHPAVHKVEAAKASPETAGPPADAKPAAVPLKPQPKPSRAQVLAAVKAEWPRYDGRNKGRLTPLEFSTWVIRANGASVAQSGVKKSTGIKPISAMNATSTAFARADADHDGGITPEEMTSFLLLPPQPTALQKAKAAVGPPAVAGRSAAEPGAH